MRQRRIGGRSENIRDVPTSVTALQGDILEALATSGQDVRALSGRVSSLNIESSFGQAFPRFYLRGYGNTDFRLNASQPVSLVYDDVVQEDPILKGFPIFDVERVEVLRGPQGSLFGCNTPAGVVKFDSVRPGKKAEGYGSLSFGTFSTVNAEGAATLPLTQALSMRLSVFNQTRSDWVDNTFAASPTKSLEGYRDSAMRAQLQYDGGKELNVLGNIHARVAFDVFSYTVKDLQLTAVGGAANANVLLSAKRAQGQGFELDFQTYLSDRLLATVGVGYNDPQIQDGGLQFAALRSLQGQPTPPAW